MRILLHSKQIKLIVQSEWTTLTTEIKSKHFKIASHRFKKQTSAKIAMITEGLYPFESKKLMYVNATMFSNFKGICHGYEEHKQPYILVKSVHVWLLAFKND